MSEPTTRAGRTCPCDCSCSEPLRGIEERWGLCILCHNGEHWQAGDDEPAFDWPTILAANSDE